MPIRGAIVWDTGMNPRKGGRDIAVVIVVVMLVLAVERDVRTYKIPNYLIMCGILICSVYCLVNGGVEGLKTGMLWLVIPLVITFPLFAIGAVGAGDVKLYAVLGMLLGRDIIFIVAVSLGLTALYGVVIVLIRLLKGSCVGFSTRVHLSIPIAATTFGVMLGGVLI